MVVLKIFSTILFYFTIAFGTFTLLRLINKKK